MAAAVLRGAEQGRGSSRGGGPRPGDSVRKAHLLFLTIFNCSDAHNIKFTTLATSEHSLSGVKCPRHRAHPPLQRRPVPSRSPPPPPSPTTLTPPGASCEWGCVEFVPLPLAHFPQLSVLRVCPRCSGCVVNVHATFCPPIHPRAEDARVSRSLALGSCAAETPCASRVGCACAVGPISRCGLARSDRGAGLGGRAGRAASRAREPSGGQGCRGTSPVRGIIRARRAWSWVTRSLGCHVRESGGEGGVRTHHGGGKRGKEQPGG